MNLITPQKGLEMLKAGVLLLDVRSPGEFRAAHAREARCFPLDEIQKDIKELRPLIEKYSEIVLICKAGKRAQMACDILSKQIPGNFSVIEGGTDKWIENNLPIDSE